MTSNLGALECCRWSTISHFERFIHRHLLYVLILLDGAMHLILVHFYIYSRLHTCAGQPDSLLLSSNSISAVRCAFHIGPTCVDLLVPHLYRIF